MGLLRRLALPPGEEVLAQGARGVRRSGQMGQLRATLMVPLLALHHHTTNRK
jgi:hypothetical protein